MQRALSHCTWKPFGTTAFRNAASRLKDTGKLVVYKVGQSEIGAEAAASLPGQWPAKPGLRFFRQCGAIRVDDMRPN